MNISIGSQELAKQVTFNKINLLYKWIFCTASSSGVTLGKANRMVEVHGKRLSWCPIITKYILLLLCTYKSQRPYQTVLRMKEKKRFCFISETGHEYLSGWLQYISPQSQSLLTNLTIAVSDNNHDILVLPGTTMGAIEANDRIYISTNKTTLTISNTKDFDAGKYQVRIDS